MKRLLGLAAVLLLISGFVGFTLPGYPPTHKHGGGGPVVYAWDPANDNNQTLSNGNLTATSTATTTTSGVRSTTSHNTGKYYFEVVDHETGGSDEHIGLADSGWNLTYAAPTGTWNWSASGNTALNGTAQNSGLPGWGTAQHNLGFAVDFDNHKAWVREDGGAWNSGLTGTQDPASNTGGIDISGLAGPYYMFYSSQWTGEHVDGIFTSASLATAAPAGFAAWDGTTGGAPPPPPPSPRTVYTSTLTINGQSNQTYNHIAVSTTSGDCIDISNSTNITISDALIGKCGTNNSTSSSQGVMLSGNNGVNIYDSYIHVENKSSSCSNSHLGIYLANNNGTVNIKGNVIAYNETHIEGFDASNVTVDGNSFINTLGSTSCSDPNNLEGHGVQFWRSSLTGISNIFMTNNYLLDSAASPYLYTPHQSDGLSCGHVTTCNENGNYVVFDPSGGTVNVAACGVITESGTTVQQENNVISQTYNGGTCMSNTNGGTMTGNKVELKAPSSSTAGGMIVEADTNAQCANVTVSGNTSYAIQSSGFVQGYFQSSKCPSSQGITESGDTLNAAALSALDPIGTTNPPPKIPPVPHACVAASPYSTQTSVANCPP
jgi:hypothetical protein